MADSPSSNRQRSVVRVGDYVLGTEIGRGSFATVYKGYNKVTSQTVAIKSVGRSQLTKKLLENLESEIAILKRARHDNVVELLDCLKSRNHIHLVVEYCSVGDLSAYIKRRKEFPAIKGEAGGLKEPIVRHFLNQLASALEFLQACRIIHRDIKPQNLLLCPPTAEYVMGASESLQQYPNLKVADFGFARSLPSQDLAETLCGSPLYMAPEILGFQKYSAKADLWSTGAVLYEVIAGRPPFRASNHIDLLRKIELTNDQIRLPGDPEVPHGAEDSTTRGNNPALTTTTLVPADLQSLVRAMLKRRPDDRISFQLFFQHPALKYRAPLRLSDLPPEYTASYHRPDPAAVVTPPRPEIHTPPGRTAPAESSPSGSGSGGATSRSGRSEPHPRDATAVAPLAQDLDRLLTIQASPAAMATTAAAATSRGSSPALDPRAPAIVDRPASQGVGRPALRESAPPTAEKEYVMVDKRTVEVNILADELASSPKSGRGRLGNYHATTGAGGPSHGGGAGQLPVGLRSSPTTAPRMPPKSASTPVVFSIANKTLQQQQQQQQQASSPLAEEPGHLHGRMVPGLAERHGPTDVSPQPPRLGSRANTIDVANGAGYSQPPAPTGDASGEWAAVERIQGLTTKAQAVTQLADQKLGHVEDLLHLPNHRRQVQRPEGGNGNGGGGGGQGFPGSGGGMAAAAGEYGTSPGSYQTRVQTNVEEAFALYHRALSLLEIGLHVAERYWQQHLARNVASGGSGGGGVTSRPPPAAVASVAFNSAVQLARHQFNLCEERAEYVKSKSPTDELNLRDLSVEQMLHDAAIQSAKHALYLYHHQEFILCERGYQWAIHLLEALLEPVAWTVDAPSVTTGGGGTTVATAGGAVGLSRPADLSNQPMLKLDPRDQARAEQCIEAISHQLESLRRRILNGMHD
ncbi:Serine/threonine-protein kinase [Tieghemiomyces parasiticus]|uniref:non-specific serine/threonine protein kinase n=1 Tax=Tieghemiomyces parasiticus TaxID=78921 RepID=A0A9W7ZKT2_9FUNG|nr:Serine/threonine-protein kinase [Tieghemiomyces parasiticus]